MTLVIEVMGQSKDLAGRPTDIGWRTDTVTSSRYWAGRRYAELTERGEVTRIVNQRGDLVNLG